MALSYALITKQQVKDQLGGTFTAEQDATIDLMIDAVTMYAEKYIGRYIKARGVDLVEVQDIPQSTNEIYVRNFPIISVTSFVVDGQTLVEGETDDYYQYDNIGLLASTGGYWIAGRQKAVITYEGGYAEVPEDLQNWAVQLVVVMYQQRNIQNLESERVGEISVTYKGGQSVQSLLLNNPEYKLTLDQYKSNYISSWV